MPPLDPQAQQVLNQRNAGGQPAQQAQPQPQSQPAQRGAVFGPPVVADQPTAREIAADERAAAADRRAAASDARAQATFEGTGGTATEGQAKISTMLTRILGGSRDIAGEVQNNANAQSPGFAEVSTRNVLGEGIVSRATAGETRRIVTDAQADMIDALLTLSTGAAYTPEQVVAQRIAHFPQLGDTPREIAIKNQRLQRLMEAARVAAGPQWGEIEAAITPLMPAIMGQTQDRQGGAGGTMGGNNSDGNDPRFTPPAGPQPTLQDLYPEGAQMGMDQWGQPDAPFDRIEYLRGLGIQPDAERQLVGVLNATAREKGAGNVTQEDVLRAYEQAGIRPGDEAAISQILTSLNEGRQLSGFDTTTAEQEYSRALDQTIGQRGGDPESVSGAIGGGAVQGLTLNLADEVSGLGGALNAAIRGQSPATGYLAERDVSRREFQRAREASPTAFGISEFGGALATGGVRVAPAAMRAARPVVAAAREGAIVGGAAGFGAGEGLNSLGSAAIGAGTGALAGAGLTVGARALAPGVNRIAQAVRGQRVAPALDDVNAVVQAGERMAVPVRRADVDPAVRDSRAAITQSPAGQAVRAVEADDLAAMEQALAQRTGSEGVTPDRMALGDSVQNGTRRVIERARARASGLYKRAFRASDGVEIAPTNMIAAIDENIAELTRNGATQNAAAINFLRGVRSDAMNGGPQATGILNSAGKPIMRGPKGLSIEALRSQRTNLRGNIDQAGLSMTDMERRMTNVLTAASSDIEAGLANNADALAMFREADGLWREQADFANSIGRRLLGTPNQPVTPEAAAQRIAAFVRGDFNRARTLYAELPEATRAEISAQVAANLGRKANGDFSLATFLTHTGPGRGRLLDERTTRLIFGDRGVEAIRDLRTLAGAKVAATERTNYINTGGLVQRAGRGLRSMILGAVGVTEGGLAGGAVTIAAGKVFERLGEDRAVRLLTNPDFTKWMRRLPDTDNPRAIDGAFGRLRRVASGNAQFQSDVQAFEQALLGAANDNSGMVAGVAAEPQDQQQP